MYLWAEKPDTLKPSQTNQHGWFLLSAGVRGREGAQLWVLPPIPFGPADTVLPNIYAFSTSKLFSGYTRQEKINGENKGTYLIEHTASISKQNVSPSSVRARTPESALAFPHPPFPQSSASTLLNSPASGTCIQTHLNLST